MWCVKLHSRFRLYHSKFVSERKSYRMASNPAKALIDIDGAVMEGGGQILRNALALSVLLKTPVRIHSIRAGRSKPGLRPQHLKCVEIAQKVCCGTLDGAEIGSSEITFHPGNLCAGNYSADVKTAGSISLLIQVGLPCALFANGVTNFFLRGGTDVPMAPPIDYIVQVYGHILNKFGGSFNADILKRGYFPRGGGEVRVAVQPTRHLNAVEMLEQGDVTEVWGRAYVAGRLPIHKAKHMAEGATRLLTQCLSGVKVSIEHCVEAPKRAIGDQAGIIIFARTSTGCILSSSALGEKNTADSVLGERTADELLRDIKTGACVDRHAQDQVIILMALAQGRSRIRCGELTLHAKTAIHVSQLLTAAKFNVLNEDTNSCIIECEGIGFKYL